MNRTDEVVKDTIEDWKDLGFFYDLDEKSKCWKIVGNRNGLMKFCKILKDYASNPGNEKLSEHEYFGPYMFLTLATLKRRKRYEGGIVGTLSDIEFMSNLVKDKLSDCTIGDSFEIGIEYDEKTEFKMIFQIMDDEFDPSSLDPMEWANSK